MIWIKLLATFVLWSGFGFLIILSTALLSGSPSSDMDKVVRYATLASFVPLLAIAIYKLVRFYMFNSGELFVMSDVYWFVLPTLAVAYFVYSSR